MFTDIKNKFTILEEKLILPDIQTFKIYKDELKPILIYLQKSPQYLYERLDCICVTDNNSNLEFYYFLSSDKYNTGCAVTFDAEYDERIISVSEIYKSADYDEREIYDLFGVNFINHPNLKRILLPDSFIGNPLRKNYKMNDERLRWNYV